MSGDATLALAFTAGLFGAFHCLGMCSGLAGGYFAHRGRTGRWMSVLAYHGARILVYAALGVAGAALGQALVMTGLLGKGQGLLMIAAGVVIVALGLDLLGLLPLPGRRRAAEPTPAAIEVPVPRPRGSGRWEPALAGAVNGLVPCSLVFSVAVKAAATADPARAGVLMAAFGLGTLPTMGLVSLFGAAVARRARGTLARLAGAVVVALGGWTLYEGVVFFEVMRGLGY